MESTLPGVSTCKNRPQVAAAGGEFVDDHLSLAGIVGDPGRADRRNGPRTRPGQEGHRFHPSPVDGSRGCLSGEGNCPDRREGQADPCKERHGPCHAGGTTGRAVAGLSSGSGSSINVALDAMTRTAQATRDRAAALDMKAKALRGAKTAEEDPNIPAAMAGAAGPAANATVADRLASLQQRK